MEEENITVPQNQIEMHQETGLFDQIEMWHCISCTAVHKLHPQTRFDLANNVLTNTQRNMPQFF